MNKVLKVIFVLIFNLFFFIQISYSKNIKIITTTFPLYIHTLNITKDSQSIDILIPPSINVHNFNCKPSDILKLEKADVLIINGATLDNFILKVIDTLKNKNIKIIDTSLGIDLIPITSHHHHEQNDHSHLYDPHIWLSLKNAIIQVNNIKNAICKIDILNAKFYEINAKEYINKLEELDKLATKEFSNFKNFKFIIFHGSFEYFAKDYNLIQYSLSNCLGNATKPSKLKEIYEIIKKDNLNFVVSEYGLQNQEIKLLSEQFKVNVIELNPMGYYNINDKLNYNFYIDTMTKNILKLSNAFKSFKQK